MTYPARRNTPPSIQSMRLDCYPSMGRDVLALFAKPRMLRDVDVGGLSPSRLALMVVRAEAEGLLCSPGKGPWWVLMPLGRLKVKGENR